MLAGVLATGKFRFWDLLEVGVVYVDSFFCFLLGGFAYRCSSPNAL